MNNILVTGATGNVGMEVINSLLHLNSNNQIIAGVRNTEKAQHIFKPNSRLQFITFDFEDSSTFENALNDIDLLFLLRPPQISDIETYFKPLLKKAKEKNIQKIVFLSVQGAEKSKIIPHHKIEKIILELGFESIFLRPSYFMQNLTTTLLADIQQRRKIILPAGKSKFNWIDVKNIGEAAAVLLDQFETYKNQAIELTGYENENFAAVTVLINKVIEDKLQYNNLSPIRFYFYKKRQGMNKGMILVMIMLHYIPRLQKEPKISNAFEKLTAKQPTTLKQFIERGKALFMEK